MVSKYKSIAARKVVVSLKRQLAGGRPLSIAQLNELRACGVGGDVDEIEAMNVDVVSGRLAIGKRLNANQKAAAAALSIDLSAASNKKIREVAAPKDSAARHRLANLKSSNIGEPPAVVNPARRARCVKSLVEFGLTYCSSLLDNPPPPELVKLVDKMEQAMRNGGKIHLRLPRGKGKSTWAKITIVWALANGVRRFVVVVGATAAAASSILNDVWDLFESSEELLEDYPEICYPIRALDGVMQRAIAQHINGQKTGGRKLSNRIILPTVAGSISSGAIVAGLGLGSSIRGLVRGKDRPDFVFLDDPQKREDALSESKTLRQEKLIQSDIYGLAGHGRSLAMVMATTPIRNGDVSTRFANPKRHPEWSTTTVKLVIKMPDRIDLWERFASLFSEDAINGDTSRTLSSGFYQDNRAEMEEGCVVLDPSDGGADQSAVLHAFTLRCEMGQESFDAEYQMTVQPKAAIFSLTPDFIESRISGYPRCEVPPQAMSVVGFCDVNAASSSGLRWGLLAVGRGNVSTVIAYGRWPESGRLYEASSSEDQIAVAVARGMRAVVETVSQLPITRNGKRLPVSAMCFDGGWQTRVVAAVCQTYRSAIPLIWSKGFGARNYRPSEAVAKPGDHCHLSYSQDNGHFLAYCSDYWRHVAQRSLLADPLVAGSTCLYGSRPLEHTEFAEQIAAEKLTDYGVGQNGSVFWRWEKTGENHYGDVFTCLHMVAAYYGLITPTSGIAIQQIAQAGQITRQAPVKKRRYHFIK